MDPASPIHERRVAAGAVTLSVRERQGGLPPVLCLHGLASNARWWDLVGLRLAPSHRVVAPDLRGHGRSDRPPDGYGFETVTGDLLALIAAIGLPPAVVVGHSWGASVALWLAAAAPEQVLGCVLVDGGVGDLRQAFGPTWASAEAAMTPPDFPAATASDLPGFLARSALAEGSDPALAAEILLGNLEAGPNGRLHPRLDRRRHLLIARALWELDGAALLGRTRQPVLLIPARDARGSTRQLERERAVAAALAALGPRGAARWVAGVHDLPVQRPAPVARAILEFCQQLVPVGETG
ncbi:MAG TPA: alpha/beta hydrolase [Verrucomicrobiae bacterium]|nr:alpha/beta hydrolase [Verrucomicrobiae bacterium]